MLEEQKKKENPRTILGQIGKIPKKSGKSQTRPKERTNREGRVQIGKPPVETPRLAALIYVEVVMLKVVFSVGGWPNTVCIMTEHFRSISQKWFVFEVTSTF